MLTGQPDGSKANNSPFMGSLIARLSPSTANIPSYVWLHDAKTGTNKVPHYESGLNLIGQRYAPMRVGQELDNPLASGFRVAAFDPPEGVTTTAFEIASGSWNGSSRPASWPGPSWQGFPDLPGASPRPRDRPLGGRAFDLDREDDRVRDRYGRHPLGQYLLMARRLTEAGVRLVTVEGWPGLAPGETTPTPVQVWDMHDEYYKPGETMYGNGPYGMTCRCPGSTRLLGLARGPPVTRPARRDPGGRGRRVRAIAEVRGQGAGPGPLAELLHGPARRWGYPRRPGLRRLGPARGPCRRRPTHIPPGLRRHRVPRPGHPAGDPLRTRWLLVPRSPGEPVLELFG